MTASLLDSAKASKASAAMNWSWLLPTKGTPSARVKKKKKLALGFGGSESWRRAAGGLRVRVAGARAAGWTESKKQHGKAESVRG